MLSLLRSQPVWCHHTYHDSKYGRGCIIKNITNGVRMSRQMLARPQILSC